MATTLVSVPGVFYVDDPQDGASTHLLSTLGVTILRNAAEAEAAVTKHALHLDDESTKKIANHLLPATAEHSYGVATGYFAEGGPIVVDVRDSADAWLRFYLRAGEGAILKAGVNHRVGPRDVVLQPAVVPVWHRDADRHSRQSTVVWHSPVPHGVAPGTLKFYIETGVIAAAAADAQLKLRFAPGSAEEVLANTPHFELPGTPHTRQLVVDLCESFYGLGWVTGTGGSISIRHGDRIFMAPSGVQKERMQPQDIFVLDTHGREIYAPQPLPGKPRLKLSQCAPLFHHAFTLRKAGACIHTHDINAVMVTLLAGNATEFRITHQEMIKGIAGHGFNDTCVVPIIENTPHECDLADSLEEAMRAYPSSNAVLVRRHGVYVWGASWEAAKTQAECYHYLFEAAVRMRDIGLDPAAIPQRVAHGIGAATSYGSGREFTGGKEGVATVHSGVTAAAAAAHAHAHAHAHGAGADACCGGAGAAAAPSVGAATSDGFHGTSGTSALSAPLPTAAAVAAVSGGAAAGIPPLSAYKAVLLDIEGTTSSIQFVVETLFPYAASNLRPWLTANRASEEAAADVAALVDLSAADIASGLPGAAEVAVPASAAAAFGNAGSSVSASGFEAALAAIEANVLWQMSSNRKSGPLKQLQGHIWRAGYDSGALKAHMFPDTPDAIKAWVAAGKRVYIYSSGSREAQRLLFKHSEAGDLRPWLSGYFDTKVGSKIEAGSYKDILLSLGLDAASDVLFATDSLAEAAAATGAGMRVVVTDRPGNVPLAPGQPFTVAKTLIEIATKQTAV